MEKTNGPEDEGEEVAKVGHSFISNLKNLSDRNQHTIDYLQRTKELSEQK